MDGLETGGENARRGVQVAVNPLVAPDVSFCGLFGTFLGVRCQKN